MSSKDLIDRIQPSDYSDPATAVEHTVAKRIEQHIATHNLEVESYVRQLLREAERAVTGQSRWSADAVLHQLHYAIRLDERLPTVLHPAFDEISNDAQFAFRRFARLRDADESPPALRELQCYAAIAEGLGYVSAWTDSTRYAPVTFKPLDGEDIDDPTPVGRVRIGASSTASIEDRALEIDHSDCEHILAIALPRQGKDSTLVTLCSTLHTEHGYKWFSLFDDGRNETPMVAIPSDDEGIHDSLERFGREPEAYESVVLTPATRDLPRELPGNHEVFTIGVNSLTPELVLQLASVSTNSSVTERLIGQAIRKSGGRVESLIHLLDKFADGTEAVVEVEEMNDGEAVEQGESHTITYEMDADDVLSECAQMLTMLYAEGIIADTGEETNLDIVNEMRRDRVAILNCNYLPEEQEALKYVIVNLVASLIYRARDQHPRLPRAVLEIRELKALAPAKLADTKYRAEIKSLQQTLYFIATQGGSRRVMMAGSTQKLTDVYKPIRGNMPIKILLRCGEEEIETLDRAYHFSHEQKRQLSQFRTGQAMILAQGEATWPVEMCGAPCGLGLGDEHWLDRYGRAMGARVRESEQVPSPDEWIDMNGETHTDRAPEVGEWFLLPEDIEDGQSVEDALQQRQEYPVPEDLRPQPHNISHVRRDISLAGIKEAETERQRATLTEHDVPVALETWLDMKPSRVQNFVKVLRAVDNGEHTGTRGLETASGVNFGTIAKWLKKEKCLKFAVTKNEGRDGIYELTETGERALDTSWDEVLS